MLAVMLMAILKLEEKMAKRVVITGIGTISSCGKNLKETWNALYEGKCCFSKSRFPEVNFHGEVDNDFNSSLNKKQKRYMDRTSQLAVLASREAVIDSGLEIEKENAIICIGTSMGGMETLAYEVGEAAKEGMHKMTVLGMPKLLSNMISSNISIDLNIKGGSYTYSIACASSAYAIGEAYRKIQYGEALVAIAGGSESCIVEQVFTSFVRLNAISQSEDISKISIPFSKNRSGFALSEGAAILILEDYDHAINRNAHIYAEILGYGTSSDANSLVSPDIDGIKLCMSRALKDANLNPDDIEYINAHGTGTKANDMVEGTAICQMFPQHTYVSSSKSMHGHLLGAAGALELVACCMMIENKKLLPQINVSREDVDDELKELNLVLDKPVDYSGGALMSNSFGFGGNNASLIINVCK